MSLCEDNNASVQFPDVGRPPVEDWEIAETQHPEAHLLYVSQPTTSLPEHQPSYDHLGESEDVPLLLDVPETPPEQMGNLRVRIAVPKKAHKHSPQLRRLQAEQARLRREIRQEERDQAIRMNRRRRDDREMALLETRQTERRLREYIADEAKKVGRDARRSAKQRTLTPATV